MGMLEVVVVVWVVVFCEEDCVCEFIPVGGDVQGLVYYGEARSGGVTGVQSPEKRGAGAGVDAESVSKGAV